MAWFAAHVVIGFLTEHSEVGIPAWENVVLIEASSHSEAASIARKLGRTECDLDDELEVDGQKARRVFAGVRKISEIIHPEFGNSVSIPHNMNGIEISFSEFVVDSMDKLMQLGAGERIKVIYTEK